MFSLVLFIVNKSSVNINFNFFYTTFILIIIPFLIINGALTGLFFDQTVVWYNNKEILGLEFYHSFRRCILCPSVNFIELDVL